MSVQMFKILCAALVAGFLSSVAPPAAAQSHSQGWSIGAFVGYGSGSSRWSSATTSTGDFDVSGLIAGLHGGHSWQTGKIVYGVEVEGLVSDVEGASQSNCAGCRTDLTGYLLLRSRLGYDTGHGTLYGALGLGAAQIKHISPTNGHASAKTYSWQAAVGYDVPIQTGWSVRGEVAYLGFGDASSAVTGSRRVSTRNIWTAKLGLTRHF